MKEIERVGDFLDLSIRVIVATAVVMILFGIYLGVLIYGENSLTVLNHLKDEKKALLREAKGLKDENQRLQKEYFELMQLQSVGEYR
jgi:hypothetical protein